MPTIYSGNYSTGTYTYTRVRVDYSGTSGTAILLYTRTNTYAGDTGGSGTFTFGGQTVSFTKYFQGQQTDAEVARVNFPISLAGGTYSGSTANITYLAFSGSVTIPSQATAPTGLAASNITPLVEGFSATVSITGWGGVGDASNRFRELQCWTYDPSSFVQPRRYQPVSGNELSGGITVDNNSSYTTSAGPLDITGNTLYTLGIYATNGTIATGSQRAGNYATLAYAPSMSIASVDSTSASISYSLQADGGYYTKTVQYSLDDGATWVIAATVTSGAATSGTFSLSGLTPDTLYVLKCRVSTTAGETNGADVTFTTTPSYKLYGSVNGQTKSIRKLYGSVNGQTKAIKKLYGSVNGQTKRIF